MKERTLSQNGRFSHGNTLDPAKQRLAVTLVVTVIAAILVFVAPAVLSPFRLNLLGKFMAYALVALGLDLLWGYAGILSLGQAVFFGLGGYAMGMYLKLEASNGKLPDFMSWSGRSSLPAFWYPFFSPLFALVAAIVVPLLVAAVVSYLIFRGRVGNIYFAIITQALALIFSTLFIGQQPLIGGTNGLTNFSTLLGQPLSSSSTQVHLYQVTVVALLVCYLFSRWLTSSSFGKLLIAIRDSEDRTRFCGYDPTIPKVIVFAIAAGMAGLGGALFVPQVGIVNPDSLGTVLSMTMVVWVAVGGRGSLLGAIVGALFVNLAQSTVSESFPNAWQYFIGLLFIATVLLFPAGLAGIPGLVSRAFHLGQTATSRGDRSEAPGRSLSASSLAAIEPKEVGS